MGIADTPGYWERQYNPRLSVPDASRIFESWTTRASAARASLGGESSLRYGPHERERLDLFRAREPRGTLVFIHGGYWRGFDRSDFSWIAPAFVEAGISVALPSYPLAPAVRLARICRSIPRAIAYLRRLRHLTQAEKQRVVVVGHSAGGHLAARLLVSGAAGSPPSDSPAAHAPVEAAVCISGLFDLLPLLRVPLLAGMGWRPDELYAASPLYAAAPPARTVIAAVGEQETEEFHRQSRSLASAWEDAGARYLCVAGRHHFDVIDGLADPQDALFATVRDLFR